jgi:hypothetical protein
MNAFKTLITIGLSACMVPSVLAGGDVCVKTAKLQRQSAAHEIIEEYKVGLAVCANITDPDEQEECLLEVREARQEAKDLANEQFKARIMLCKALGGGAYDPDIDPADFTNVIDNEYLPFPVGATWCYTSETDEGTETIEIEVLADTREILGVECASVQDVVYLDGEPIEDTIDWYAQDSDGNVWYFGEISFSYEDGYINSIEGSWLAGEDGAKPGIVMLGDPVVGVTYRQEWLLGDAEDAATVLATDASVDIPFGMFTDCVETLDFLPPEPDAMEHKFYAAGIGFIYETKEDSDETVELVSYSGL